ncbi:MAG: stage II sporulation protein D [Oscillospiraceae bacterium]|nr:stage II sporulation protein D [Oscillospiraceae bacterium]
MLKFRAAIILISLIIMFLVPMTAIKTEPKAEKPPETENEQPKEQENEKEESKEAEKEEGFFRIFDLETEKISEVSYEDYVRGAIASEMGADFEFEALVAQGVAAFTCGIYQKNARFAADYDFSAAPRKKLGYMTEEKAKEIYGEAFPEKWEIICSAAEKAMEYIITYNGEPALTVYHACSNGMTESSENAWGGAIPYLVPVESEGDILWKNYESSVTIKKEKALELLNKNGSKLSGAEPEKWFEGAVLTKSGYVDYIEIGAVTFSGEKLRNLFGLRSTDFDVGFKNGNFIFTVRGYGHGVGLSQVGANYMAENGADFEEITAHYYPGTELTEYKNYLKNA